MASASDSPGLENASLLDEIVRLLNMGRDAEVIMLIGQSGAGKSAMLNTIHRVLTGENFTLAKQGAGHVQSVTLDLGRYNNCGVDLKTIRDESRREMIADVVHKLPHIVDCAGMGDCDTLEIREILELLIGGFIPKDTNIEALQIKQDEFGVGCLKKLFPKPDPANRVTKIVFIQSCGNAIPKNLIKCLNEVLSITDPATLKRKYTAEVFLLISKFDLVRDPSVHFSTGSDPSVQISTGSDNDSTTIEEFVKKEIELAGEFNIIGALEANRIRWTSYTDSIQGKDGDIENKALKFLKRMVQPGAQQQTDTMEPVVGPMKIFELYMFRLTNQIKRFFLQNMQFNITPALFVTAVVFVVVSAVLYKLLMTSV
ncbi:uncharacterized protein LOC132714942 [Ruditapes philippinarum]|uniref:uncharacterized protein LOC132714942 n=1 Tax=Ruditapes philippinarum TaxID=129788 RepID=UPI00295AA6D2|nr:uncharacterized protein LOC132714942 [Ruditapes philippinarum]